MEARAIAKYVRMSPMKVGVVLDLIRGKNVNEAIAVLEYTPKDAAVVINKVLKSVVANAENNFDMASLLMDTEGSTLSVWSESLKDWTLTNISFRHI